MNEAEVDQLARDFTLARAAMIAATRKIELAILEDRGVERVDELPNSIAKVMDAVLDARVALSLYSYDLLATLEAK